MTIRSRASNIAIRIFMSVIPFMNINAIIAVYEYLSEKKLLIIEQETDFGAIKFFCPGRIPKTRARTLLTKEPETIQWIDTFDETDTLWDIGANIGVYSLYAAMRGINVVAFEPSPGNYYVFSRNIEINGLDDRISALCIAFNDVTKLDFLYMKTMELGSAHSNFAGAYDWKGQPFKASFKQQMIGYSIDNFVEEFNPPFPNHIKIDVDGIENKIINGARNTLKDSRLKSVLVELDIEREDHCRGVFEIMEALGIKLYKREHAPQFDRSRFASVYNHIFIR